MDFDKNLFKGVYASTSTEPTNQEVEYVLQNFNEILNSRNKEPYQTSTFSATSHGLECSCLVKDKDRETNVTSYGFRLNESMTDVPKDDWDDEYSRGLYLLVCEDCAEWCLCD